MTEINPVTNQNIFESKRREIYWQLKEIGLEEQECQAEARLIIEHISGIRQAEQIIKNTKEFPQQWQQEIARIINLRKERRPLAYCLGEIEFAGLMYRIIPGVLIPRPDTETLIEAVVEWAESRMKDDALRAETVRSETDQSLQDAGEEHPNRAKNEEKKCQKDKANNGPESRRTTSEVPNLYIAEIGVGSGSIAISLLKRLPNCKVWACDISQTAITTALGNARRHGVHERLTLVHGDWRKVLPNNFDVIVSNPPYISSLLNPKNKLSPKTALALPNDNVKNTKKLQPEIYFEPEEALYAGEDGLDFYRDFAQLLPKHFKNSEKNKTAEARIEGAETKEAETFVAFEIGDEQEQAVLSIFKNNGWQNLKCKRDVNGLPRIITALPPRC